VSVTKLWLLVAEGVVVSVDFSTRPPRPVLNIKVSGHRGRLISSILNAIDHRSGGVVLKVNEWEGVKVVVASKQLFAPNIQNI
jgi:hypothetical protein